MGRYLKTSFISSPNNNFEILSSQSSFQALGGIFASLAAILSLAGGSSPVDSGFGYFLTPVLTLAVALVVYLSLNRFVSGLSILSPNVQQIMCKKISSGSLLLTGVLPILHPRANR